MNLWQRIAKFFTEWDGEDMTKTMPLSVDDLRLVNSQRIMLTTLERERKEIKANAIEEFAERLQCGMNEFIAKLIGRLEEKANQTWLVLAERNGYERAIEIVNQLAEEYMRETPTVTNGWIACGEQLPEDGMSVLVQDFDEYYEIGICEKRNGVIGITSGDWWTSANNYIAWQPLPAPYQPKGE